MLFTPGTPLRVKGTLHLNIVHLEVCPKQLGDFRRSSVGEEATALSVDEHLGMAIDLHFDLELHEVAR